MEKNDQMRRDIKYIYIHINFSKTFTNLTKLSLTLDHNF